MLTRLLALAAGAACVFGFAPFAVPLADARGAVAPFLPVGPCPLAARARRWIGFMFGVGLFGVGASWVYIALETFGGMPAPVAAIATAGLRGVSRAVARARGLDRGARDTRRSRPRAFSPRLRRSCSPSGCADGSSRA